LVTDEARVIGRYLHFVMGGGCHVVRGWADPTTAGF